MKRIIFLIGLMALLSVAAFAGPVTYSTSTSQLCVGAAVCGVATQTIGGGSGVTVTFNPVASSTVNATTNASFGEIIISCVGGGTACGSQSLAGLNLFINIAQTVPSVGNGSISGGVITGAISGNASSATITWSTPNTINIGVISYSVLNNPLGLVPPSVNAGVTSVQAFIVDNTVPEPSTYVMISGALVGLGFLRRKMNRK